MATAGNTVHKIQKFSYTNANNTTVYNSDLTVQGNLTVVGTQVYAQAETVLIKDNIVTLNAAISQSGTPLFNAGIEVDRGNQPNVSLIWNESSQAWQFTNNGTTYESLGGGSSGVYANGAFLQANGAYAHANAAFVSANNVAPQVQPAFDKANGAYAHANAAFVSANNVAPQVQPAFDKANAAYAFANTTTAWGTRQAFKATAGQTIFSPGSGYLAGYIDVYYNGLKLYGTEDYTATDGINVTLTNPATVNSIIEIVGFGANVPVANIYVLNSMASLLNRQTFYANSGQTTYTTTLSYRVGYVDVYYNGIKMNIPEDVTANNGTTINFVTVTPTVNSIIEIVGLTPNVALANAIPITGGSVSGGLTLAGNVLPSSTNTYYLGSDTQRWHSIFVGPGSVDIGGLKLSNVSGTLSVSSPGSPAVPIAGEDTWVRTQANASFLKANTPSDVANSAALYANGAFVKANSGVQYDANTSSTGSLAIPIGTTAQRPAAAANGALRYNTSIGRIEGYLYSSGWVGIISDSLTVEYLIIAGGGGGGGATRGGGGGAGGYISSVQGESSGGGTSAVSTLTLNAGTYTVIVGAGGDSGAYTTGDGGTTQGGTNGSTSSFGGVSAVGGGGGGATDSSGPGRTPKVGGSGGGGWYGTGGQPGIAGTAGQGFAGGVSGAGAPYGSGGGGAGGVGGNYNGPGGGVGGVGVQSNITGTSTYRAGGGSSSDYNTNSNWPGGLGGGGIGRNAPGITVGEAPSNGTTNTGGGGGASGNGGSGVVIIRYTGAQRATGGTVTSAGGYTVHTFTGSSSFVI